MKSILAKHGDIIKITKVKSTRKSKYLKVGAMLRVVWMRLHPARYFIDEHIMVKTNHPTNPKSKLYLNSTNYEWEIVSQKYDCPMIYYFAPFDSEKNIGRSHNQHCEIVPNAEDWICITDSDVLFLLPDTKKQIEDIIQKHGNDYQVFGCLTNRIASPHQRHRKEVDECTDILVHKVIAERYQIWHYDEVIETTINVAGFLMVFQKKTWDKYRFSDNSIRFDSEFTDKVKADGGRLAIMRGVYVFHDYRLGHDNPMYYIDHLT